jgi:hypothetical protein
MIYFAFLDADGYVLSTGASTVMQDGAVELDGPLQIPPLGVGQKYHLATKTAVDIRTDQQKYDQQAALVRDQRNNLLAESDWTDTASAPTRLGQELYDQWQTYRQALRDVTAQPGYPFNIVWPTPPQ